MFLSSASTPRSTWSVCFFFLLFLWSIYTSRPLTEDRCSALCLKRILHFSVHDQQQGVKRRMEQGVRVLFGATGNHSTFTGSHVFCLPSAFQPHITKEARFCVLFCFALMKGVFCSLRLDDCVYLSILSYQSMVVLLLLSCLVNVSRPNKCKPKSHSQLQTRQTLFALFINYSSTAAYLCGLQWFFFNYMQTVMEWELFHFHFTFQTRPVN